MLKCLESKMAHASKDKKQKPENTSVLVSCIKYIKFS